MDLTKFKVVGLSPAGFVNQAELVHALAVATGIGLTAAFTALQATVPLWASPAVVALISAGLSGAAMIVKFLVGGPVVTPPTPAPTPNPSDPEPVPAPKS